MKALTIDPCRDRVAERWDRTMAPRLWGDRIGERPMRNSLRFDRR
ncbi:hypothetical protein [Lysobacter gummosus]